MESVSVFLLAMIRSSCAGCEQHLNHLSVSTLERRTTSEKRVEFLLPSSSSSREVSSDREEGAGQLGRIFGEGGLLEELR